LTDITPGNDFQDDIRPADIAMALGGCWVLLGVIVYLAVVSLTAPPTPVSMVSFAGSEFSQPANIPSVGK
jgi:hypothetical protein